MRRTFVVAAVAAALTAPAVASAAFSPRQEAAIIQPDLRQQLAQRFAILRHNGGADLRLVRVSVACRYGTPLFVCLGRYTVVAARSGAVIVLGIWIKANAQTWWTLGEGWVIR